jgi:protoporphyrinogen oxidase
LNDIKGLMGNELITYKRTIKIKFLGNYFKFPLAIRDVLFKLPPQTVAHAGISFLWHFVCGICIKPKEENSETLLQRYYGNVLYEIFFKSYILRVWGIPPSEFSPAFARERIPRLNPLAILDKVSTALKNRFNRRVDTESYVEKVEGNLYTTNKGFSLITQRMGEQMERQGGQILLNSRVVRLIREGKHICAVEFQQNGEMRRLECRGVINTLPINEMVQMTEPAWDDGIMESAHALKYRSLVFVGLLVHRPVVLQSSFMYFREHSFNRISDLAQFGFHVQPEGCTLLVAEISCDVVDRYWTDEEYSKQAVIADLLRENLVTREEILETHVFRAEHSYPIYTLHYEKHRAKLLQAVADTANAETAGRQGRFQYINTHIAMKMGYEAADRLITKLEERPWSAYRQSHAPRTTSACPSC